MVEILQNKNNLEKIEFFARGGDEFLGKIAGNLRGDFFVIDELECDEFFADGLVRAILNLMSLHGVEKARFELENEQLKLLKKLRFFDEKPEILSISEFFDKKCG